MLRPRRPDSSGVCRDRPDGMKSPARGSQATGSPSVVGEAAWECVLCQQGLGTTGQIGDNDQ